MLAVRPTIRSAMANTLASTTITFCPNVLDSSPERYAATTACGDAVENLIQSGLIRVGDQTAPKIFLQGLMRACRSFAQDTVGVFRNVFNQDAGHGAIFGAPGARIQVRILTKPSRPRAAPSIPRATTEIHRFPAAIE